MTHRRALLAAALVAPALPLFAQPVVPGAAMRPAGRLPRIGMLSYGSPGSFANPSGAFREGLRELGYRDGESIAIEYRFAGGRIERLPDLAAELVHLPVDVIVAASTAPTVAARQVTASVPIVAMAVVDPVRLGLAASLARPGGNVTGMAASVGYDSFVKALELLAQTFPSAPRVAVLTNPGNTAQPDAVAEVAKAGRTLGLQLRFFEARYAGEFEVAFAAMERERITVLYVVTESLFVQQRAQLAQLAAKHRLPSVHTLRENVEAGGLFSYGPDLRALARRAATYVDKILTGARPGDLPIEQPTVFELVINLKTAKALGVTIPQGVLLRADELIE
jgi:putative tryptophan/tyrosine transport system substrate-binding protein